ncbi:DUF397 domain-containing protein [Streptomyces rubiginosohelvolus]|uniref:DUF397 domain-containing protein n=1 Tax=Streptomyces rubiginosohelvolus TaxID=67362 RepID=A0ABW6F152_9ACTN
MSRSCFHAHTELLRWSVEVAAHPAAAHIRDSKVTDGPVLTVEPATWNAFVHGSGTAL